MNLHFQYFTFIAKLRVQAPTEIPCTLATLGFGALWNRPEISPAEIARAEVRFQNLGRLGKAQSLGATS